MRWKARGSTATLPLHAIADRLTPTMRRQFLEAIALAKGRIDIRALASAFDSRSYVRVAQVLEQANLAQDLGPILRTVDRVFSAATAYTATELSSALGVPYSFDLTNPRAVAFLERYHLRLIREIDQGTREGIRQILLDSFNDGVPPLKAARRIREIIGLTERQSAAVATYERDLLADGMGKRAATAKADKYAAQLLKVRSEAIARTETIRSAAEGQQAAWQDAANRGVLDRENTLRVWITSPDDRLCDLCEPMEGQEVGLDEPFTVGDGSTVMTPPAHVQCRCSTGISRA